MVDVKRGALAAALHIGADKSRALVEATRFVAEADGASVRGRSLVSLVAHALGVEESIAKRDRDWRVALANSFPAAEARQVIVDVLVVAACIDCDVSAAKQQAVETLASELAVRSPWVDLLPALRKRRVVAVKRALATRSPDAKRLFKRLWQEEGALGLVRALVFVVGLHRDHSLAARFRALESLPEGSFGRALFDHCSSRSIAFPGERGGMPERMMHHDLMHVLNGFDTDAAGECAIAGFYAGAFSSDPDWFTFLAIALATFHLGLRVSPAAVTPTVGAFDPRVVLTAWLRGRRLRVDVMGPWDYWQFFPLPLHQARRELGIELEE